MIKPYYQDKWTSIYLGNCLEIMPELKLPMDMILADLPYGTTACKWDTVIPFEPLWQQYKRLIKDNGAIVLTASQPFTSMLVASNLEMFKYEWVWDKINGANFMNLKNRPFKTQEQVLIFSKATNFTFNPIRTSRTEKSLTRDPTGSVVNRKQYQREVKHYNAERCEFLKLNPDGLKHPIDIIKFSVHEKGRYQIKHPTKKPVALFEYLIRTYTNAGDTVLDNVMGSGTTLVAAKQLNRKAIGIEIEEKYCEMAVRRLTQEPLSFNTI